MTVSWRAEGKVTRRSASDIPRCYSRRFLLWLAKYRRPVRGKKIKASNLLKGKSTSVINNGCHHLSVPQTHAELIDNKPPHDGFSSNYLWIRLIFSFRFFIFSFYPFSFLLFLCMHTNFFIIFYFFLYFFYRLHILPPFWGDVFSFYSFKYG